MVQTAERMILSLSLPAPMPVKVVEGQDVAAEEAQTTLLMKLAPSVYEPAVGPPPPFFSAR